MKRMYLKPKSIVIDLEPSAMLCSSPLSGDIGDPATNPAKAPMLDNWDGWADEDSDW